MFDKPQYTLPVPQHEVVQVQNLLPHHESPQYDRMANNIIPQLVKFVYPDGVFYPPMIHILTLELEARLIKASEEESELTIKKECKKLAATMLAVNKKSTDVLTSLEIKQIIRKEWEAESQRCITYGDRLTFHQPDLQEPEKLVNPHNELADSFDDINFLYLKRKSSQSNESLRDVKILAYSLYLIVLANVLKLADNEVHKTPQLPVEKFIQFSDLIQNLMTLRTVFIVTGFILFLYLIWILGI